MKHALLVASCVLAAALPACGGDGGDGGGGGGGGDGASGMLLTESNAEQVAGMAASSIDLFPGLSQAVLSSLDRVDAASSAPGQLAGLIQLGDLGICATGSATGVWNDADGNATLSAGDQVVLTATDCDGVSGTVALLFLEVGSESGSADIDLNLTFREQLDGTIETETLSGKFALEISHAGPPGTVVFRYLVSNNTDGSLKLTSTRDGVLAYEMGCFNFYFTISEIDGSFTLSEPIAVFKVPGQGIVSLVAWGLPPLDFPHNDYPIGGEVAFWGEADVLPCASLGVPAGGVDANSSHFTLTASGAGVLVLEGEDASGTPFSVPTNWDDIR